MLNRRTIKWESCGAAILLFLLPGCGEPRNPGIFQRLDADLASGNLAAAKTTLEQYIRSHPGGPLTARAYSDLGVINYRLGDEVQAVVAMENSLRLDAEFGPAAYNLGVLKVQNGDELQGMSLLLDSAQFDETGTHSLVYAAAVMGAAEDWAQATELLQEARGRDPSSAGIMTALALAQLRTTGAEEAITSLHSALEADPRFAPALFNLGLIHGLWMGDPTNGVSFLEEYLEFGTDDTQAMTAMDLLSEFRAQQVATEVEEPDSKDAVADYIADGIRLLGENRNEEALTSFRKAVAGDSDSVPAYLGIAEAAMRADQPETARIALDRSLRIEPENREAMWGIAAFLDRTSSDPKGAVRRYQDFIRKYPADPRTRKARERIASLLSKPRE